MTQPSIDLYGFPCPPRITMVGVRGSISEDSAIKAIQTLGITYHDFFFHHLAKVWWFRDCKDVPDKLPESIPSHRSEPLASHWEELTTPRLVKVKMNDDDSIIIGELSRERDFLVGCYTVKLNKSDKDKYGTSHIGMGYDCEFVERA